MTSKKILGIDFDGVIHDCIEEYSKFSTQAHREYGVDFTTTSHTIRNCITVDESILPKGVTKQLIWERYVVLLRKNKVLSSAVLGAANFLVAAKTFYDEVVIISGSPEENIRLFLEINELLHADQLKQLKIYHVLKPSKTNTIKKAGVITYVGDMVNDGVQALEAGAKFIGVLHEAAFSKPDALVEFKEQNPGKPIFLANGLEDVVRVFKECD